MKSNQIIIGDCREVMATFPPESIGLILTSPPYNVGLKYEGFDDNLPEDKFKEFNLEWLYQSFRVAKDTSRMYVAISDQMLFWFREYAEKVGWKYVQKLTWCKPNIVNRSKTMGSDWAMQSEDILLFRKGKRTPMINTSLANEFQTRTFNWLVETVPQSNFKEGRIHPAQMPITLCKKIIARTPGNPVLDPFAGSGQVLRAAKALGREYVGIELVSSVAEKARQFIATNNSSKKSVSLELFAQ
jgi:DNA modification methylase